MPLFLSDLKKYYPIEGIIFDEVEFTYLDYWIQIFPIFEEFLGHLLVNDTPLTERSQPGISSASIIMEPPIAEDYYFGEGSYETFLEIINCYLDNRLELKKLVTAAWSQAKLSDQKIPSELGVYFICNYLIKDISKYTLRFVVANLTQKNKYRLKEHQQEDAREWEIKSLESKAIIIKYLRERLQSWKDKYPNKKP